jgi:hypothetical protein
VKFEESAMKEGAKPLADAEIAALTARFASIAIARDGTDSDRNVMSQYKKEDV